MSPSPTERILLRFCHLTLRVFTEVLFSRNSHIQLHDAMEGLSTDILKALEVDPIDARKKQP